MRLLLARATPVNRIFTFALLHAVVVMSAWLVDVMPAAALPPPGYSYCQLDSDGDDVGYGGGICVGGYTCSVVGYTFVRVSLMDPTCTSIYQGGPNENDNCPTVANANQLDTDNDLIGDVCDGFANPTQSITVTTPPPVAANIGDTFPVAATASSGLTVAITVTSGCSIAGGVVTMTSTRCTVMFDQVGTLPSGYSPAPQVISITKIPQTITVTTSAPANAANTSYFNVAATASSGLAVVITVSGGCTIASGVVTINSAVTACIVNYNQGGDTNIGAAPQVSSTTNVNAGIAQTITVTTAAPATVPFGNSFPIAATASSGLPVLITVSGGCTLVAGTVNMENSTACTVRYQLAGDAVYQAAFVSSVTNPVLLSPSQVSSGWYNSCAIDTTGVHCWGITTGGQATVPVLVNPTQVSVGGAHACALDSTGVHCWGSNGSGQATVPALVNPTQVSAGYNYTCALDDTGVHCWGSNGNGQSAVPALVNPTQVSANYSHTCALDNTGVHCWGSNSNGQTTVPALVNPTQVSAGYPHTCALDNTGVKCWGSNSYGQTTVPALANPVQVSASQSHTCALDDTGVHCWGYQANGTRNVPALVNPVQISAGYYHACALDDTGVVCWGNNDYGQAASVAAQYGQPQTITVTTPAPASAALNSTFPVAATASSGLTVAITVSGGCTITSGIVTMTSAVTACTVNYDQAGSAVYLAATQVMSVTAALAITDADSDGIADITDNCPLMSNANQLNMDADALGDVCDGDIDGDGVPNGIDANPLSAASAAELILPLDGTHNGAKISGGVRSQ